MCVNGVGCVFECTAPRTTELVFCTCIVLLVADVAAQALICTGMIVDIAVCKLVATVVGVNPSGPFGISEQCKKRAMCNNSIVMPLC